jgi:protein TonB
MRELVRKGVALSVEDARVLEDRLAAEAGDEDARIELMAYYSGPQAGVDHSVLKAARLRHVQWLVENDADDRKGLLHLGTSMLQLHCGGASLADAETVQRVNRLWLERLQAHPADTTIRSSAVEAVQYCSPELAESILTEAKDSKGLGVLYADAVLGLTGRSYLDFSPSGSDSAFRARPFAARARQMLGEANGRDLLVPAVVTLMRDGGDLWADGKLDWDYTPFGNDILARAKRADPNAMGLMTVMTTLPARGERPPLTIRVSGNVQQASVIKSVPAYYPPAARAMGITGTVRMSALIGLDGSVLYLHPESGPNELIPPSLEAVRQWKYKRTTMDGKPCYVVTTIDVNYQLTAR